MAFTPGSLLMDSFKTTMANLAPFLIIAFICKLPVMIWDYHFFFDIPPSPGSESGPANLFQPESVFTKDFFIRFALDMFLNTLCQAAMVYGTVQFLSGRRVPMDECLSKGLSRLIPALGVALACSFIIGCGTILFIIPGIVLTCILYLAIPVSVMENLGVARSIHRSRDLTSGHRMILFLTIFSLFLLVFFAGMMIGVFFDVNTSLVGWLAQQSVVLFFAAMGSVVSAVAYMRLRERKDGVEV
ncbi:MAG: hypothetical protein ABIK28_16090, partial [Planctomycetota bacterium]